MQHKSRNVEHPKTKESASVFALSLIYNNLNLLH